MSKISLKTMKNGLSRSQMRNLKGAGCGGCGCVNSACATTHGGNGDSYCNGTFCCG